MLLQSGGGTWGTALHTVRGVGSGSRDVDAWTQTSLYAEDREWTTLIVYKWLLKPFNSIVWLHAESRIVWKERMYDCMYESIKVSTLVASSNFLLVHFGISQFSVPVFLSRKEEGRASCVCYVMQKSKSAFKAGQHKKRKLNDKSSKMVSRQKQNKHSICGKGNRHIHQVVLVDVRVLGEVTSLRCVRCASSFCLNILLRLDMTHADLSPSPTPSLSLMTAQGSLYFRCTGHQVFWGQVRRSAQEPSFTRVFPFQNLLGEKKTADCEIA